MHCGVQVNGELWNRGGAGGVRWLRRQTWFVRLIRSHRAMGHGPNYDSVRRKVAKIQRSQLIKTADKFVITGRLV